MVIKIDSKLKKKLLWLACFVFLWLIFSVSANSFLDPDFGWHLQTGGWIWQNQTVPKTDPFSYTMPNYQWQNYSWLSDLLIFLIHSHFGYFFLTLILSFLASLAFLLPLVRKDVRYFLIPLGFSVLSCLGYISVRPTMVSFLFASIAFFVLRTSNFKFKILWFYPLLIAVWVNFHSGFMIGLSMILLKAFVDSYQKLIKKNHAVNDHFQLTWLIVIFSVIFSFINPYGVYIYQVVFNEMVKGGTAHWQIIEWLPYSSFNLNMLFYTSSLAAFIAIYPHKFTFFEKTATLCLFLVGFFSRRFLIYFFIFTLPLVVDQYEDFSRLIRINPFFSRVWKRRSLILLAFIVYFIFCLGSLIRNVHPLSETRYYPSLAVNLLKNQPFAGNLFSTYNWGGYLIWKFPEKKVFIDGRMNVWEQNGYSAFRQQNEIFSGKQDWKSIFDQYSISTALLPAEQPKKDLSLLWLISLFKNQSPSLSFSQKLLSDGWKRIYYDKIAQILAKP